MRKSILLSLLTVLAMLVGAAGCKSGGGGDGDGTEPSPTCGTGTIEGDDVCDDGNVAIGDGCDDQCQVEDGWNCPNLGEACVAKQCGDGVIAGNEKCDDSNLEPADGCDEYCQLVDGYKCPTPGAACELTTCGDNVLEDLTVNGTEECDDGNTFPYDGCDQNCKLEPACTVGAGCASVCGDGNKTEDEGCDDGNTIDTDGCSSTCVVEEGYSCEIDPFTEYPTSLPIVFRDFKGASEVDGHPDFEFENAGTEGCQDNVTEDLVLELLGTNGKPQFGIPGAPNCGIQEDGDRFGEWYTDVEGVNKTIVGTIILTETDPGSGSYEFDSRYDSPGGQFFPLDDDPDGWGDTPEEDHDYHFTSEVRYWFTYQGTEDLSFSGDDDVWVFVNGHLAVDLGGVHGREEEEVLLSDNETAWGLEVGHIYEMALFHAERHVIYSNFWLTLGNFVKNTSVCEPTGGTAVCGDGTVTQPQEQCDDGEANGTPASQCRSDCTWGEMPG